MLWLLLPILVFGLNLFIYILAVRKWDRYLFISIGGMMLLYAPKLSFGNFKAIYAIRKHKNKTTPIYKTCYLSVQYGNRNKTETLFRISVDLCCCCCLFSSGLPFTCWTIWLRMNERTIDANLKCKIRTTIFMIH